MGLKGYVWNGTAWVTASGPAILPAASTSAAGIVQLSDSTSTTSSVLAATPTAAKAAYDLAAAAVPKSTVTTAGDLIYGTGSAAVSRLALGTAGKVLTVNAGATAPEWATAASGGMTLIATATLSAATAVSFTSIPGTYKHLLLTAPIMTQSVSATGWYIRVNSSSVSYQNFISGSSNASNSYFPQQTGTDRIGGSTQNIGVIVGVAQTTQTNSSLMEIYNYASSIPKSFKWMAGGTQIVSSTEGLAVIGLGYWNNTSAITQIDLIRQGSTTTLTGTIYLYGVS